MFFFLTGSEVNNCVRNFSECAQKRCHHTVMIFLSPRLCFLTVSDFLYEVSLTKKERKSVSLHFRVRWGIFF